MENHLIIGSGNLGCDLANEAIRKGHRSTIILSKPTSPATLDLRVSRYYPKEKDYCEIPESITHIWYTRGYGSIEQAETNPKEAAFYHMIYPALWYVLKNSEQEFHSFSTCYNNEDSFYVRLKRTSEYSFHNRSENSYVHNVQYLYGVHHPMSTFIGKIIKNRPNSLPRNQVSLTPTRWIAEQCIQTDFYFDDLNLVPKGTSSLAEWGRKILEYGKEDFYFIEERDEDDLRSQSTDDDIDFPEHLSIDLFDQYAPEVIQSARKIIENEKT